MNELEETVLYRNKLGIILIPSRQITNLGHRRLNKVLLEDDTIVMARDDELEPVEIPKEE